MVSIVVSTGSRRARAIRLNFAAAIWAWTSR